MATEFPISMDDEQVPPSQDDIASFSDGLDASGADLSDMVEQPDGSVIVSLKDDKEDSDVSADFLTNLADEVDPFLLNTLAGEYLELIENDKEARSERDKQYEDGLKRTGLGNDAPGGAQFQGASKVVHPVLAEACIDFESKAIKELFPPDGPVRTNIIGESTDDKLAVAERKRDFMNWQLTEQIEEFRDETEQMLTQLPLGGSQYLKLWYDAEKRRPCAEFIPIDNILLPFAATNFYTANRATEVNDITQAEFERRVLSGLYSDVRITMNTMEPQETAPEKANNKIEGRKFESNIDGLRRVFHVYTNLEIPDDKISKGKNAPYILMIDDTNREVVGLYRNWEEGDPKMARLDWIVEYKFIPWRGAYAIGLPHLIGGLAAALTGALRALLDSAHINNSATMLKLKGAKISGQSQSVQITQVAEIEGAPGVTDIRQIAMPMPFNPPSPVLYQLLGFLTDTAKGVVTTSEEKIADIASTAPVGTTQALIEQGAAVFSSIHARLHSSQAKVLKILARLNRWYLDEMDKDGVAEELDIQRDDFKKNTDILPVSDPHIFSETQRMAQNQAVIQLDKQYPGVMDPKAIVKRTLKQMKIPNIKELMPNQPEPHEMNAAEENMSMSLGRPSFAYPFQDHLAHIAVHMDFANNPVFGMNPIIAPQFLPNAIEHIKQHILLWYSQGMKNYVEHATKTNIDQYDDNPQLAAEMDKVIVAASKHIALDTQQTFSNFMMALQQLVQRAAQYQQKPPLDPANQVLFDTSMAETQRRAAKDKADLALEAQRLQSDNILRTKQQQVDVAKTAITASTEERIKAADITHSARQLEAQQNETALEALQAAQQANQINPSTLQ